MPILDLKGASEALTQVADFDFSKLTGELSPEGEPSLTVKFDIGGGRTDGVFTVVLPSVPLHTDDSLLLPAVQDDGLLLPAVQTDYGWLLPY